jgi:hypothetical protein
MRKQDPDGMESLCQDQTIARYEGMLELYPSRSISILTSCRVSSQLYTEIDRSPVDHTLDNDVRNHGICAPPAADGSPRDSR